jgi:hypothetical protein
MSIIRQATRDKSSKYNILTGDTHEAYQTGMAKSGDNYYAFQHESFKKWNDKFRGTPSNYHRLMKGIPDYLNFDFILSQNKFGQFQIFKQLSNMMHLPLISLEHTLPMPGWPQQRLIECNNM